jgi:ketosteroid isomerase-like protein
VKKLQTTITLAVSALFCSSFASAYAVDTAAAPQTPNPVHFIDSNICKVDCVDPHPACEESQKVIDTLKKIYEAFGRGDMNEVSQYIDEDCTTFDESTHKLIVGKKEVLEDIRRKIEQFRDDKESPLLSYTIERPYAEVKDNMAVVTFVAIKQFGGKHPQKLVSHCTDIFKKENGRWMKSHFRSLWKPVT